MLKKYAVFEGRARRTEFWMFTLFNFVISIGLSFIDELAGLNRATHGLSPLSTLYALAVFIPGLAVQIRRLHDTSHSGWCILLVFIPIIGWLILLLWMVREGDRGRNEYGRDPKSRKADLDPADASW